MPGMGNVKRNAKAAWFYDHAAFRWMKNRRIFSFLFDSSGAQKGQSGELAYIHPSGEMLGILFQLIGRQLNGAVTAAAGWENRCKAP